MRDQATELRKLVLAAPHGVTVGAAPVPQLMVLTGGKGGVGTTTLAVNLAVALADQGARVVLVDADLQRADVTSLCGLGAATGVADVLSSRRDIHEVLMRGPCGLQIVPGVWATGKSNGYSEKAQYRLLRQLRALGRHAEWVLVDVGHGAPDVLGRFWHAADHVLLVSTPEPVSVMDTYATIKTLLTDDLNCGLHLVVNRAANEEEARDVHRRIDQSCRRFLGRSVGAMGFVPGDPAVPSAARQGQSLLSGMAECEASRAIVRIAAALLSGAFANAAVGGVSVESCPGHAVA